MTVQITESYPPITEEQLQEFEKTLGSHLPPDYRQFLLDHNGGKPKPRAFKIDVPEYKDTDGIHRFFSLHETDPENLSKNFQIYQEKRLMPHNLLPIAMGIGVSLLVLSIAGDDYGKVYYWDADGPYEEGMPDYSNVHFLADSFTEFLGKLYNYMGVE